MRTCILRRVTDETIRRLRLVCLLVGTPGGLAIAEAANLLGADPREVRGDVILLTRATMALYEEDDGRVAINVDDLAEDFVRLGFRL